MSYEKILLTTDGSERSEAAVGRSGLDRMLLGSVTEKVIRSSKIPVLTVSHEE